MHKELEDYLWKYIPTLEQSNNAWLNNTPYVRDIIDKMKQSGMINNEKQAWRTLEKWSDLGKYEYGTILDLGWKVEEKNGK